MGEANKVNKSFVAQNIVRRNIVQPSTLGEKKSGFLKHSTPKNDWLVVGTWFCFPVFHGLGLAQPVGSSQLHGGFFWKSFGGDPLKQKNGAQIGLILILNKGLEKFLYFQSRTQVIFTNCQLQISPIVDPEK